MSHQHAIYTDSLTKATIGSHQLPIPMNWKILIQPNEIKAKTKGENPFCLIKSKKMSKYLLHMEQFVQWVNWHIEIEIQVSRGE